jgi:hypothetical protein
MAEDQKKKTVTGGNTPKPPGRSGGTPNQSAKERSKAQSRPVSGKSPTGKSGQATGARAKSGGPGGSGGGGNKPRPGGRPAPGPEPRRFSGAMMAWGAVGLVIVVVAVLVVVKVATGSSAGATSYTPVTAAPASVVKDVTTIPASVYDTVGVNFPSAAQPVSPPIKLKNQPPLSIGGKSPAMLYYGAEYCPYCAAERWAIVAALSRFGTWSNLKITASSHTDVYNTTHTFSFKGATFTSPYLTFASVEQYSNVPVSGGGYTTLENPTKQEQQVIDNDQKDIPNTTPGQIGFPFINIGNVALISGATYNPGILAGLTWTDIAGGLNDPTNPVTQSIVGTANYISAAICASTKDAPASVCNSSGVKAAAKSL